MPFIFNALKINSTLALIGAIVAEFFGTPTRESAFAFRSKWRECRSTWCGPRSRSPRIAGMAFYGIVALAERATTFWHPSYGPDRGWAIALGGRQMNEMPAS